jgi:hypothetical protein
MINGPEGRLEARYTAAKEENAPIALLLHPHPQHGGTMNNKVVYTLFHAFLHCGFSALRFNFRGVGRSQGQFGRGEGEVADATSALDWLQATHPNAKTCWVGGFSFGAWIGMQLLMRRPEIGAFVSIAPPAGMFDFSFLAPCPTSGLIVQGDQDQVVPLEASQKLVTKLRHQRDLNIDYRIVKGADHFFYNNLPELGQIVEEYVTHATPKPMATAR